VPAEDDYGVANNRRAGGIVLGKTNTPEFGAGGNTRNRVYGATGNPFDPAKTSGGSSGGSAAALALGQVALATGSDLGGSLRTPAAFCGVVGFRPSPGVGPSVDRANGLFVFSVIGPMGRSVEDAHLLLRAQIGEDKRDLFSSGDGARIPSGLTGANLGRLRVAVSSDLARRRQDHRRRLASSISPARSAVGARARFGPPSRCSRFSAVCSSWPPTASAWRSRAICSTATSSTTPSAA
jgi:Asp-tRNA(Asn)/Glu-tRNA(Gln) amidotransferase A subunit family amidase